MNHWKSLVILISLSFLAGLSTSTRVAHPQDAINMTCQSTGNQTVEFSDKSPYVIKQEGEKVDEVNCSRLSAYTYEMNSAAQPETGKPVDRSDSGNRLLAIVAGTFLILSALFFGRKFV